MWTVLTTDIFDDWFDRLEDTHRINVLGILMVLRERGPRLGRPYVDSVNGSIHSNMKELRIQSKGVPYRAFFAFDHLRRAIILCAGEKSGGGKRFYQQMLLIADNEFSKHINTINEAAYGQNT